MRINNKTEVKHHHNLNFQRLSMNKGFAMCFLNGSKETQVFPLGFMALMALRGSKAVKNVFQTERNCTERLSSWKLVH